LVTTAELSHRDRSTRAAIGTRALLYGLILTSILGAVVTWFYRIETTGVNLDEIGRQQAARTKTLRNRSI
jgi:hypothetical protein